MRLLWISGRCLGSDLAGSTEVHLSSGLNSHGVEVTLLSPGNFLSDGFRHVSVGRVGIPGLQTLSGAFSIKKIIKSNPNLISKVDYILVDWRYVTFLKRELVNLNIPWAIIDRGPPATSGVIGGRIRRELLRNIQKKFWKSAWEIAGMHSIGGFVVSSEHDKLVRGVSRSLETMIIPSGANPNKYLTSKENPDVSIKFAYVGRLDRKRGMTKIFDLSTALVERGINHHISIAGEGDMSYEFDNISQRNSNFTYLGKTDMMMTERMLAEQHVGIMPMPDKPVWRISSPIKLSEYAASGLAIVGPNHPGNRLPGRGRWDLLSEEEDWVSECVESLEEVINRGNWEAEVVRSALESSEDFGWVNIAAKMLESLKKMGSQS